MALVPDNVTAGHPAVEGVYASWPVGRLLIVAGTMLAAAFVVTYLPVIGILRGQWATNDTYSFGVLVPFISGYLIWSRRDRLQGLLVAPSLAAGGLVVAAAAALLLPGRLIGIVALQELSMVVMLAGLVLLVLGYGFLKPLLFPLTYLLLMLPVWEIVTDPMHHPSQLLSAGLAGHVLTALGVPVLRDGVYLDLPNITLEVATACSGINFLIAVVAVGVPQAYLYLRGWLPRATVIVFAVAIALLSNGLRVALIGLLSYHGLSASLHGPGHVLQGLFVSGIGFLALLASVTALGRRYGRVPMLERAPESRQRPRRAAGWRVAAASAGATAVLLALSAVRPDTIVLEAAAIAPPALGTEWRPLPSLVSPPYISDEAGGQATGWVFEAPTGQRVHLYIGPFAQGAPGGGLMYRSVALPLDVSPSQVVLSPDGETTLRVNRAVFLEGDREIHVVYWYDLNGMPTAQGPVAKAYASAQVLTSWGAAPRLVMAVEDTTSGEFTDTELLSRLVLGVSRTLSSSGPSK